MHIYKNLILIGSSHIAQQSADEVKKTIEQHSPSIICLELDHQRFIALQQKKKTRLTFRDIRHIGLKGYLFTQIAQRVQTRLGNTVGTEPGVEMLEAIKIAREKKLKLALIDQNITITLKKLDNAIGWKERYQFIKDLFLGIFFKNKVMAESGLTNLDLSRVPDEKTIRKMIHYLEKRYPSIFKVLISDRNHVMANNLKKILNENPDETILGIVGAGHIDGIMKLLKDEPKITFKVIK